MCGIWASVGLAADKRVIDLVEHRGPDGQGWREATTPVGRLFLGHRRLAIIATDDSGLQPLSYGDGRFWIVFNGEIYNYIELRADLEVLGHRFVTRTDTEVLLAAYAQWGEACLHRFNGMFAFVIHDTERQTLFAARDRFGVKPFYLYATPKGFACASEIKQFLGLPDFAARADLARIRDFLISGLLDHGEGTMFAGVRQLRGGQCLSIDLGRWRSGQELSPATWYRLPTPDTVRLPLADATERFQELLRDSVRLRLRADVPVGSCLSGGLDSSSIVCLVHDLLADSPDARRHAVSCCFDDPGLDEATYVKAVIEQTRAISHIVTPSAEQLWASIDRLTWHQDEPFGSTSIFAQWSVFAEARANGITVMLDGQGADEQLGGYHTMFGAALAGPLLSLRWVRLAREILALRRRHRVGWKRLATLVAAASLPAAAFDGLLRLRGASHTPPWLNADGLPAQDNRRLHFQSDRVPGASPLGALSVQQLTRTSVPMLLHWEDRNSMAHGIEARVPFLDYRLVEFNVALGEAWKLEDGETKAILRRAMERLLPPTVRHRQDKLGFPTPEERWFKGPLRKHLLSELDATVERFPGLFHREPLRRWASAMLDGTVPFNFALWRVISLGRWARLFRVGEAPHTLPQ